MELKKKVPELRFKGFSGEWEADVLGELTDVYDGTHQTPHYTDNGIMFLSVENIKTLKSEKYISEEAFKKEFKISPQKGDVLMTRIGDIGTANVVESNEPKAYYVSLALLKFKKLNPYFLKESISSDSVAKSIFHKTLHIAFPKKINKNEIAKVVIPYPKIGEEQSRIGSWFQHLDQLITLHQKKYNKLTNIKKAMLEKMFPKNGADVPEIRFEGFEGGWEKKKFKDIISVLSGGTSIKPDDYQEEGVRTIPKGAVNSTGVADLSGSKYISNTFFDSNNYSKVSTGELVTSLRDLVPSAPNMGRIVRIEGNQEDFLMPQGVYKIKLCEFAVDLFLIAFSNSNRYRKIISSEKNGSTQVHIRNGEFLNIEIFIPDYLEQKKIGTYFQSLDQLITLHQIQIEKLKNLKKACLEKMFV